jgi:hypothetical protein
VRNGGPCLGISRLLNPPTPSGLVQHQRRRQPSRLSSGLPSKSRRSRSNPFTGHTLDTEEKSEDLHHRQNNLDTVQSGRVSESAGREVDNVVGHCWRGPRVGLADSASLQNSRERLTAVALIIPVIIAQLNRCAACVTAAQLTVLRVPGAQHPSSYLDMLGVDWRCEGLNTMVTIARFWGRFAESIMIVVAGCVGRNVTILKK